MPPTVSTPRRISSRGTFHFSRVSSFLPIKASADAGVIRASGVSCALGSRLIVASCLLNPEWYARNHTRLLPPAFDECPSDDAPWLRRSPVVLALRQVCRTPAYQVERSPNHVRPGPTRILVAPADGREVRVMSAEPVAEMPTNKLFLALYTVERELERLRIRRSELVAEIGVRIVVATGTAVPTHPENKST